MIPLALGNLSELKAYLSEHNRKERNTNPSGFHLLNYPHREKTLTGLQIDPGGSVIKLQVIVIIHCVGELWLGPD